MPSDENVNFTKEDEELYQKITESEQRELSGVTIAQLEDIGCWGHKDALPSDLNCPIHPMHRKDRWRNIERIFGPEGNKKFITEIDIGDGIEGEWTVDNPVVWNALEPCLRLATLIYVT